MAVLGEDVPGGFKFRKPGADHKARFMAYAIYGSKMFLLQDLEMMEQDSKVMEIEFDEVQGGSQEVCQVLQFGVCAILHDDQYWS